MRGKLAVLAILGVFALGAVWILVWAPAISRQYVIERTPSWVDYPVPPHPATGQTKKQRAATVKKMVAHGATLYKDFCASCHGDTGRGDGEAAEFLTVKPRNLWIARFRFKTTTGDNLPRDEDIFRTLSLGAQGTPMPGWEKLLDVNDRWALVEYIKSMETRGDKWNDPDYREKPDRPIGLAFLGDPPTPEVMNSDKKILWEVGGEKMTRRERGAQLFEEACSKCHGPTGMGDGPSAAEQKDESGTRPYRISPRNFHRPWEYKRGRTLSNIAVTISQGLNGTGMPAHDETFDRKEIWYVANHVMWLSRNTARYTRPHHHDPGARLGPPEVTYEVRERAWRYEVKTQVKGKSEWKPLATLEARQGQLVRLKFQPTDNGQGSGQGFAIAGYERKVSMDAVLVERPATVTFRADRPGTFKIYNPTQSAPGRILARMTGTFKVTP